jgi:hypothetical protein
MREAIFTKFIVNQKLLARRLLLNEKLNELAQFI